METIRHAQSQGRLQDIVGLISDWVWEVDANGVYTYCGGGIQQVLGYSAEEVVGRTPFDLMLKEEKERVGKIFVEIVKQTAPIVNLENWNYAKNGEEVCLLTNGVPFFDVDGNMLGYRGVDKDITDQKRIERRLAIEREQLLSIFDHIDATIYISDPVTNEILYANKPAKQIFNKNLVGNKCYEEWYGVDRPCDFCTNEIILKNIGKAHKWEYYNPTIDKHFEAVDQIIKWPDGRNVRLQHAVDITEHRKTKGKSKR